MPDITGLTLRVIRGDSLVSVVVETRIKGYSCRMQAQRDQTIVGHTQFPVRVLSIDPGARLPFKVNDLITVTLAEPLERFPVLNDEWRDVILTHP